MKQKSQTSNKEVNNKKSLQVGQLVKFKSDSLKKRLNRFILPPYAMIISLQDKKYKNHRKNKLETVTVARLVWMEYSIPEYNAGTDESILQYYQKYYTTVSIDTVSDFNQYIEKARKKMKVLYKAQ